MPCWELGSGEEASWAEFRAVQMTPQAPQRRRPVRLSLPSRTPSQVLAGLLSSGLALLGALISFVTSGVALKDGPFCMFDVSSFNQTQAWKYGYPFKDLHSRNYLYDRSLWNSACLEPSKAVVWHVAFFSALLCVSLLQLLLMAIHIINSFLGLFCSVCEK
ncbi:hypothetical protein P7K49_031279 [Saguinus oedipus]|uniref:Transmembrane 4 L6 family member 19 n=1 Tax=Saguinus oedipus TaxID=9490 RepID=A0ABQ9U040_SAGOE|nr:hypothetical protein P7K49_031279 [Saguinus oedipus]